ncbi:MAG: MFS transporter [Candidatus Dadabacteria bacterium]
MSNREITLGLRENLGQFSLLVLINAFVGGMVGLERTIVPLIAERDFGLVSKSLTLSFIVSFGIVKALSNLFAGRFSDYLGRKKVLLVGWIIGLPVPFLIILAPGWNWIIFANILLGINQGLCWSMTVIMKIDLAGPHQRGLAMGLNEFAGYISVSLSALATGYIAALYALRPQPFYLGIAFTLLGFILSAFFIKETQSHAQHEATNFGLKFVEDSTTNEISVHRQRKELSFKEIFFITSWKNKVLFSISQAGLVNNLNDGMAWGLFPLFFVSTGLGVSRIGIISAAYPATWGILQLWTGALSDKLGRKWMIAVGMWVQALGICVVLLTRSFGAWITGSVLLGLGTALVYPTLLAAVSDVVHPELRASSVGVYRFWRDMGYAFGALLSGIIADRFGISWAIGTIGALTFISGVEVAKFMHETLIYRGKKFRVE